MKGLSVLIFLGAHEVDQLFSTHEEADTRVLLHAQYAAKKGCQAVVIVADDTDILVLAISHSAQIDGKLYLLRGNSDTRRLLDISQLGKTLGPNVCRALPGLHAFTGTDYTSAFAGQGKLKAMKLLLKETSYQELFSLLGSEWELSEENFQALQQFTCHLYAARTNISSVNKLRYHIYCAKRGDLNSSSLPPSKDPLKQHCRRANYVAGIWQRSLEPQPSVPSPSKYGWNENTDGELSYKWMTCSPAPEGVLKMIICECRQECKKPYCPCANSGIVCIEACRLQACENFQIVDAPDPEKDDYDDSYERFMLDNVNEM